MVRREDTETLAQRYLGDPTIEDEDFDCKSKEKFTKANSGKQDIVKILSAMANTQGGTILVGVGENSRGEWLQSFSTDSEAKRDLVQTARDNTHPSLDDLLHIKFVQIEVDDIDKPHHILRIDVEPARTDLIDYDRGGDQGYVPHKRVGDTTKPMSHDEVAQFARDRWRPPTNYAISYNVSLGIDSFEEPDEEVIEPPQGYALLSVPHDTVPVLSPKYSLGGGDKSVYYELESPIDIKDADDLSEVLDQAQEFFETGSVYGFGYSFYLDSKVLAGTGKESLISDFRDIRGTINKIIPSDVHPEGDHRPVIIASADCPYGLFYTELYWKHGSVSKSRCGLILDNMPFRDQGLQQFFKEVGGVPGRYEQRSVTKQLRLEGVVELQNHVERELDPAREDVRYLEADNPFYQKHGRIRRQANGPIPDHVVESFCDISRLVFEVDEARVPDDDLSELDPVLNYIDVTYSGLSFNTYFVDAGCWLYPH
jgi:hypothetical protein